MKRSILVAISLLASASVYAQESAKSFTADPFNHPMMPIYAVMFLLVVVCALVLSVGIHAIRILNLMTEQTRKTEAEKRGETYMPSPGWWDRLTQKMNASVPVSKEAEIELGHNYDGIKELDNHLPPWWKWLFYGTIGWSAVYLFVFHISDTMPLSEQEYRIEIAQAEEEARQRRQNNPQAEIDENNLVYNNDPAIIAKGKELFSSNPCSSCHRQDGGGNTIGPNLTDAYWIHGGEAKNVFAVIKNGAVDKGMPAWNKSMSPQDIRDVTFYILSLQGSNPPEAKAPQGQFFRQATIQSDSLKMQASMN